MAVSCEAVGRPGGQLGAAGGLAAELAARLGCGVLAMRYPVVDDFAIALAEKLYGLLAGKAQPLPRALGIALADREVIADPPTAGCPALSVATPALFGARAVGLRLPAPQRNDQISYDTRLLKLAGFPPQPGRFVGRTAVMAQGQPGASPPQRGIRSAAFRDARRGQDRVRAGVGLHP